MSTKACPSCSSPVPVDDLFCGKCGHRMTEQAPVTGASKTLYFSGAQPPGRAKLVLVRGDSSDGVSYQLNGTDHVVGRREGSILFAEDTLVSPKHANFFYRDSKLFVRDEGSTNGVFIRIKNNVPHRFRGATSWSASSCCRSRPRRPTWAAARRRGHLLLR